MRGFGKRPARGAERRLADDGLEPVLQRSDRPDGEHRRDVEPAADEAQDAQDDEQ